MQKIEQSFKARDARTRDMLSSEKQVHKAHLKQRMAARRNRLKAKQEQHTSTPVDAPELVARESKLAKREKAFNAAKNAAESKLAERESKLIEREKAVMA